MPLFWAGPSLEAYGELRIRINVIRSGFFDRMMNQPTNNGLQAVGYRLYDKLDADTRLGRYFPRSSHLP